MITLHDVLTDLTYGEFAQLKLANFLSTEHESEPDPKSYAQLCSHINIALKAIYTRFPLAVDEVYIQLSEEIALYHLSYEYAESNIAGLQPTKYIMDTIANPFPDNVLHIEEVYNEVGELLPLNNPEEDLSVFTPTYRTIQVPWPNNFNTIAVQYQAGHPKIVYAKGMDATQIEVLIPHALHEALLFYIASRVLTGVTNNDGSNAGNSYYAKYKSRVDFVVDMGMYIQSEQTNTKFENRGFV